MQIPSATLSLVGKHVNCVVFRVLFLSSGASNKYEKWNWEMGAERIVAINMRRKAGLLQGCSSGKILYTNPVIHDIIHLSGMKIKDWKIGIFVPSSSVSSWHLAALCGPVGTSNTSDTCMFKATYSLNTLLGNVVESFSSKRHSNIPQNMISTLRCPPSVVSIPQICSQLSNLLPMTMNTNLLVVCERGHCSDSSHSVVLSQSWMFQVFVFSFNQLPQNFYLYSSWAPIFIDF